MEHQQLYKVDSESAKNGSNTLSVLIGNKLIKYALYDEAFQLLDLSVITNPNTTTSIEIDKVFDSPLFNSMNYTNCIVGLTSEFAVIPQEYFDDNKMEAYLAKQLGVNYKIAYSYDILESPNVRIVYKKDKELIVQLNSFLRNTKVYNSISPLISNIIANYKTHTTIVNNFFEDEFDYICLKQGKLQMANRYNCSTPENYLYYLLNAMQINKVSQNDIKVIFSGDIDESDHHSKLAQNYLPGIAFLGHQTSNEGNLFPLNKHYNLFVLAQCAL